MTAPTDVITQLATAWACQVCGRPITKPPDDVCGTGKPPVTCANLLKWAGKRPPRAVTPGAWPNNTFEGVFDMGSIPESTHAHGIRPWAQ